MGFSFRGRQTKVNGPEAYQVYHFFRHSDTKGLLVGFLPADRWRFARPKGRLQVSTTFGRTIRKFRNWEFFYTEWREGGDWYFFHFSSNRIFSFCMNSTILHFFSISESFWNDLDIFQVKKSPLPAPKMGGNWKVYFNSLNFVQVALLTWTFIGKWYSGIRGSTLDVTEYVEAIFGIFWSSITGIFNFLDLKKKIYFFNICYFFLNLNYLASKNLQNFRTCSWNLCTYSIFDNSLNK